MAHVPSEADRLLEAGRKKILRACLLFGGPLLGILVLAGLQCAGAVRLEAYFEAEQRVFLPALAVLALFQFLLAAIGVLPRLGLDAPGQAAPRGISTGQVQRSFWGGSVASGDRYRKVSSDPGRKTNIPNHALRQRRPGS